MLDRIFDLMETPLGSRIMGALFGAAAVVALVVMAVFVVQHAGDECPPNTPKLALAHQTCINRLADEEAGTLP